MAEAPVALSHPGEIPADLASWDPVEDALQSLRNVTKEPPAASVLKGLPLSQELLQYYRSRMEEFDKEREDMIARVEALEMSRKDAHQNQWEKHKLEKEVEELQKGLSDSQVHLFDEREKVLKLCAENDQLKIQEIEDRQRIQALLALTKPTGEEVTYFRDCRPAHMRQDLNVKDTEQAASRSRASAAQAADRVPSHVHERCSRHLLRWN